MRVLGHDNIKTTINIYGHLQPSAEDALAEAMGKLFKADNVVPLHPNAAPPEVASNHG